MPADGVLSFARFMELALYCPVYGFYEKETDNIGRDGDFYTNVSTGSLFGELLAFQFAEWLEEMGTETRNQKAESRIVETGAHDGKLAKDILNWLRAQRPKQFGEIEYAIIEPAKRRQEWQSETLKEFSNVRWFTGLEDLKLKTKNSTLRGVIFSNELLDAMPVHRFGWDARNGKWFEWGVALEGNKFIWAKMQTPDARRQTLDPALLAALPDGYIVEISPEAENWWRDAAQVLTHGKLLTLDYGFTQPELFSPARTNGTLRSYRAHRHVENILANPGEQDITAHVNFAAIQASGEQAGLKTEALISQYQFLTRVVERMTRNGKTFEWTPARARQLQTLTHPEHLGRAFRVLVQSRRSEHPVK